jgi:hypothetical protein
VSFRVLVIPEDASLNGYLLRPLVERLLAQCGKPNAEVRLLPNAKQAGYEAAKRRIRNHLWERAPGFDLWLFMPDSDLPDRSKEFAALETEMAKHRVTLLCCAAVPEVEVWLLAGYARELSLKWAEVRNHSRLNEVIAQPFLDQHDILSPGQGREILMRRTLRNYRNLLARCPELQDLEMRIKAVLRIR